MNGTRDTSKMAPADRRRRAGSARGGAAACRDRAGGAAAVRSESAVDQRGHGRRDPRRLRLAVALDSRAASLHRAEPRRGRAGVRGGGGRVRSGGEGLPARDRRGQRAVGAAAAGSKGSRFWCRSCSAAPCCRARCQALWRQRWDRLRRDPGRGAADHRRHDRPGNRRQQGRLAAVRRRARGRVRRGRGRVRGAERSLAGSRDRSVHRGGRLRRGGRAAASPGDTGGHDAPTRSTR